MTENLDTIIEKFSAKCEKSYPADQADTIKRALSFAVDKHRGQNRVSGEPYVTHPIAVADIIIDLGLDYLTVCAALLHDTVEDTETTEKEIERNFGPVVETLVLGVTKLQKIKFTSKEEEQAENFRRMFVAMAKDIRVLIIKLADRLHNMRTIDSLPEDRRNAMAEETLEIYSKLAGRLGLSYIKCELEDTCLKVLQPEFFDNLVKDVSLRRNERQAIVDQLCVELKMLLSSHNIDCDISGRPKHFYSIYKKMTEKGRTFDQIYDLTAVRILVKDLETCYEVLGIIHSQWKPMPGRFKDYIAMPKANNYQSLHTTVMTKYGTPFEIQIRTFEMHRIAEYGIAAHWKYKEKRSEGGRDLSWLSDIISEAPEEEDSKELFKTLKYDIDERRVFIFTPKGDVLALPLGSTPIDFAYNVHSAIGNKCVGAKINNKIVPLDTKLETGDYVEIITSAGAKGPSRDWLKFVVTGQAKSKIKAFFKKEMKEENIKLGREMMELEAKKSGYSLPVLLKQEWVDMIMRRYSFTSLEDMYASVGYGGFSVHQILPKLIDFYRKDMKTRMPPQIEKDGGKQNGLNSDILIKGEGNLLTRLGRCCNPVPGDDIVGFVSNGRGVTVHRVNCPNLNGVEARKLIEASWAPKGDSTFTVSLQINADSRGQVLVHIPTVISEMKLSISFMNARTDKNDQMIISLGVKVNAIQQADSLISKIGRLPSVNNVFRTKSV